MVCINRIKQLREEKGWTQLELGKLLNVNGPAISKYETGRTPLTDDTLKKLAELFNESTDYILGLSNRRKEKKEIETIPIEEGLSEENIEELKKYAELLKIKQMAEKNKEETSDEISSI